MDHGTVRVIRCPEFLRYDASGSLDADATRAALRAIAEGCASTGIRNAMLDVRDISDAPTIAQLFWVADDLLALGFSCLHRLALVYTDHGQGRAAFFASSARTRGFNIRDFTDFEAAFEWLGGDSRCETPRPREPAKG